MFKKFGFLVLLCSLIGLGCRGTFSEEEESSRLPVAAQTEKETEKETADDPEPAVYTFLVQNLYVPGEGDTPEPYVMLWTDFKDTLLGTDEIHFWRNHTFSDLKGIHPPGWDKKPATARTILSQDWPRGVILSVLQAYDGDKMDGYIGDFVVEVGTYELNLTRNGSCQVVVVNGIHQIEDFASLTPPERVEMPLVEIEAEVPAAAEGMAETIEFLNV